MEREPLGKSELQERSDMPADGAEATRNCPALGPTEGRLYVKSVAGEFRVAEVFIRNLSFKGVDAVASRNTNPLVFESVESALSKIPVLPALRVTPELPVVAPIVTDETVAAVPILTVELALAELARLIVSEWVLSAFPIVIVHPEANPNDGQESGLKGVNQASSDGDDAPRTWFAPGAAFGRLTL